MLDYTRHLLPGSQGRNPAFRHAVLEFVVENPELFKAKREGGTGSREGKVRFIMRRLNTFAGYQLFPFFNKQEIKELIADMRDEILQYKDAD
jgi:muconolactone delta-isomerase